MNDKPCVNCGAHPDYHHIAGRALICNRQWYYAPTHDHPNARTRPSITEEKIEEVGEELACEALCDRSHVHETANYGVYAHQFAAILSKHLIGEVK